MIVLTHPWNQGRVISDTIGVQRKVVFDSWVFSY